MARAIKKHIGDFLAILALFLLAMGIGGYILSQQRLRLPFIDEKPFVLKVELPDAQAVQPGQGQTVRVAGVEVGQIGEVELEDGEAVVEMQLEQEHKGLIRRDATALLRTKTGLKDMFIEIDPGTGEPLKSGERIRSSNSAPDVDPDEVLSALDADTRDYLKLLISGGGEGLRGRGLDLRETLRRFGPLHRDLAKVTTAVARRRRNLSRLVHNYGLLTRELSTKDAEIARLVQASNQVFEALASDEQEISSAVSKLPGTLRQTQTTLGKVDTLSQRLGPALDSLRPAFRQLASTNAAVLPLAREGTPIVRNQIRPFARIARPFTRDLGRAARGLEPAVPDLTKSFNGLNRFLNIGAFNPGGAQGLTGNPQVDRNRQEGFLFWLAWTAQNTVSLFNTSDATGPARRFTLGGLGCGTVGSLLAAELSNAGVPPATAQAIADGIATQLGNAGVCA